MSEKQSHPIYNEKLSFLNLLSHSWNIFVNNIEKIFAIVLLSYLPIIIINRFLSNIEGFGQTIGVESLILILENFLGLIPSAVLALLVKRYIDRQKIDLSQILNETLKKMWKLFTTNLISLILIMLLILLFIIPGIVYGIYWGFAMFVVIFKDISGKKALDYSKKLVEGRWRKVFRYTFFFLILYVLVGILINIPSLILYKYIGYNELVRITTELFVYVVFAFTSIFFTVFFINIDSIQETKE